MNNKIAVVLFSLTGMFSACAADLMPTDTLKMGTDTFPVDNSKNVFHLAITNETDSKIKILPIGDAEFESDEFKLNGEIITPPAEKRTFPTLEIQGKASVPAKSCKQITVALGDIDFSSTGLAKDSSIVQRMAVKTTIKSEDDEEQKNVTIGYMSFRCSVFNISPVITFESTRSDYQIIEDQTPTMGNSGIKVLVRKVGAASN